MILSQSGFFTATHILVIVNVVLAASATATAIVGLMTIKSSNRVVSLSKEQLELERQALQASIKPLVIARGQHGDVDADYRNLNNIESQITMTVVNIGPGPAIVHSSFLEDGAGHVFEAQSDKKIIEALSGVATIWGSMPTSNWKPAITSNEIHVGINYSDVADSQRTQSLLTLCNPRTNLFRLHKFEVYLCDAKWGRGELQVESGSGSAEAL
jgi:hypothetical protein